MTPTFNSKDLQSHNYPTQIREILTSETLLEEQGRDNAFDTICLYQKKSSENHPSRSTGPKKTSSELCYRHIAENIPDVLWSMDNIFNITFISPTILNLSGYSHQEFLALPMETHLHPNHTRQFRAIKRLFLRKLKNGDEIPNLSWEFELLRKDGRIIWVETVLSPFKGSTGVIQGFTGSAREVTERVKTIHEIKKAMQATLQANKAKSSFITNTSHEIRTPMNGVLGMLQILRNTALDGFQAEYVDSAIRSGVNLLNLINDILDLSKIESGKVELEEKIINFRSYMDSIKMHCKSLNIQQDVALNLYIDQEIPKYVCIDDKRLRQILYNIIGNSIKFTKHGKISVYVSHHLLSNNSIQLFFTIRDTGSGISPDILQTIYEPFIQDDGQQYREAEGSGLGLSIVKRLVELMDGAIQIESPQGQGSEVLFNVGAKKAENVKVFENTPTSIDIPTVPMHILVVEDDRTSAKVAHLMLRQMGHSVNHASNGFEALKRVGEEKYDCILMDIQMPEMDGIEASLAIRSNSQLKSSTTPIIALTAHAMKGDREHFLSNGMSDCITKPIDAHSLMDVLNTIALNR